MRRVLLLVFLASVPAQAVMPFSWTSTTSILTSTQVVVPDGMIWRVEQVSGFHEGGISSQWPPLVTIAEQGAAADRMVYYANPNTYCQQFNPLRLDLQPATRLGLSRYGIDLFDRTLPRQRIRSGKHPFAVLHHRLSSPHVGG